MRDLNRPRLFENRLCYRLVDVETSEGPVDLLTLSLTCGTMCYFDMIEVGECLAHETARAAIISGDTIDSDRVGWSVLPFRRFIGNPFDLARYPLMLSVSTLTIRQSRSGTTFLLLCRSPAKVAIAGEMLSVFPTGVFQPASVVPAPESADFDLWRNVTYEYSEEFLGNPEHDGDGPPIDDTNTEPFRSLDAARQAGKLRVYCLGIDALNHVGDVFTAATFDADTFDRIFDGTVGENEERDVETEQLGFDESTVSRLLTSRSLAPSGAARLQTRLAPSRQSIGPLTTADGWAVIGRTSYRPLPGGCIHRVGRGGGLNIDVSADHSPLVQNGMRDCGKRQAIGGEGKSQDPQNCQDEQKVYDKGCRRLSRRRS